MSPRTNAYSLFWEWNIILSWPGNGSFHLLLGIVRPSSTWQLSLDQRLEIPILNKLWGMRAHSDGEMNLSYWRKYFSTVQSIQCRCNAWCCCIIVWPQCAIQFFRVDQIGVSVTQSLAGGQQMSPFKHLIFSGSLPSFYKIKVTYHVPISPWVKLVPDPPCGICVTDNL